MENFLQAQRSSLRCLCNAFGKGVETKKLFLCILTVFFVMQQYAVYGANKVTNTSGNWATGTNWTTAGVPASGDNATVNHAMAINTNIAVTAGGNYIINSPAIDAAGGTAHTLTISGALIGGYGTLEVKSNMTFEGALAVYDFGRLIVRNGAVLTVGNATFAALSDITVDEGGTLIVNGNMLVYGNAPQINGDLIINGNYTGDAFSGITGTGTMTTTGSVTTILTGTIFGAFNDCTGSCTYTSCASTATISPASPTVCAGGSATLTGTYAPTTIGTITYQWQSGPSATGPFSNIASATSSTYNAAPSANTYYRVRITQLGCTATSSSKLLTVVPIPTITSTAPASRCGNGSIALGATASAGTVNWFVTSTGGTSIASGNTYSPTVTGTTTYYVSATNGSCTTPSRTAVTATVNAIPTITSTTPGNRCGPGTVALSAVASAGTINWYSAATGGTLVNTGTSYNPFISATTTYYVDATATGCTTAARTAITATINPCAVIWTGTVSTDWNTPANWNLAFVPASINNVTIPSGTAFSPVVAAAATAADITVNAGATLSISAAGVLNAYGSIANSGTITTVAGSALVFAGSSAQTITGVPFLYNVQINNAAGIAVLSPLTVNGTVTLSNGTVTTNSNLTIHFDNGGNIAYNAADAGSISGTVSGRRDGLIRTHYIAAPFSGVTSAQIGLTTPLYYNNYWKLFTRDFTTQGWNAVMNAATPMPLGTGYSLAFPNTAPLILTGTYSHNFTLTGTAYSNTISNKYILVANPYPSTLDWTSAGFTKTNVANAIYLWSASTNQTSSWVAGVGTGPNGTQYIPAMQSFLVRVTGLGGTASVSINNTARISTQNPSYARTASTGEIIRINIQTENGILWDDAVIRFTETATNDFDFELDAYKIVNFGNTPSVYTTLEATSYSINSIASPSDLPTIPVSVKLPADGTYKLTITKSDPSIEYTLVDKKTGTENLISGPSYTFSGLAADAADRFELQLRTSTVTAVQSHNTAGDVRITSADKGFVVQTEQFAGQQATIEILDITGKAIKTLSEKNLNDNGSTYLPVELAGGSYLIKVTVGENTFAGIISVSK